MKSNIRFLLMASLVLAVAVFVQQKGSHQNLDSLRDDAAKEMPLVMLILVMHPK